MWKYTVGEEPKFEREVNLSTKESETTGREAKPSRDVYALGILMWELLYRNKAWDGMSLSAVHEQVVAMQNRPSLQSNGAYKLACDINAQVQVDAYVSLFT